MCDSFKGDSGGGWEQWTSARVNSFKAGQIDLVTIFFFLFNFSCSGIKNPGTGDVCSVLNGLNC